MTNPAADPVGTVGRHTTGAAKQHALFDLPDPTVDHLAAQVDEMIALGIMRHSHDLDDHQRGWLVVDWDTADGDKAGAVRPAWICCVCGDPEFNAYHLVINHYCDTIPGCARDRGPRTGPWRPRLAGPADVARHLGDAAYTDLDWVTCHGCRYESSVEHPVTAAMSPVERAGGARHHLVLTAGWFCTARGDFCPRCLRAPVNGCRWCGAGQRGHGRRCTDQAGWHTWTAPTDTQRLVRLLGRRKAPLNGRAAPSTRDRKTSP